MTNFTGTAFAASAPVMCFCIVQRLEGYCFNAAFGGVALRVAAGLAANEEGNLGKLIFCVGCPNDRCRGSRRGFGCLHRLGCSVSGLAVSEVRSFCPVVEFEIFAEHRQKMLLKTHH